jgi:hypothetical protein
MELDPSHIMQVGAALVTVRDGKVTRTETFSSPEEALEAVRLQD